MDKRNWIIIVLSIGCILLLFLQFCETPKKDIALAKEIRAQLENDNKQLLDKVSSQETIVLQLKKENLRLDSVKKQSEVDYKKKILAIKKYNKVQLRAKMDSLFLAAGIKNDPSDSSETITHQEGIFLVTEAEAKKHCDTILSEVTKQYDNCQQALEKDSSIIEDLKMVHRNDSGIIKVGDIQLKSCVEDVKTEQKKVRKQKIIKWIVTGLIPVFTYTGYQVGKIISSSNH